MTECNVNVEWGHCREIKKEQLKKQTKERKSDVFFMRCASKVIRIHIGPL